MSRILVTLLVTLFHAAQADLPVHCLHKHVRGTWTFHLGAANEDKNGIKCSKGVSDSYGSKENNYGLSTEKNFNVQKTLKVELLHPNIAKTTLLGKEHIGTWTMIYDEGFEVLIAGTKFFAFSKYTTGDEFDDYSHCGETFPGWYHPSKSIDDHKWGCYVGVKDTKVAAEKYRKFGDTQTPINENVFVAEDELVETVNNAKTTWHARHYKEYEGRPMAELQRHFGQTMRPYKLQPEDRLEQQTWAKDGLIDVSDVPENWDWRNVNGQSYVNEVINQGSCGSCYSVAVSDMISSRMRILSKNKVKTPVSADRVLKCAFYAQGCDGGFPYLAAKYAQDFGSVSIEDQPYTAQGGQCPAGKKVVSRNIGYKYIGGYYGACGEKAMLRELYDHGPFVVGFEVGMGFRNYGGGVFKPDAKLPEKNHFERVNHAVLIVGHGTDNGTPYWLVKNSWGAMWGENGFFRIQRGRDNLNIEHMSVAAYPSLGSSLPPKKNEMFMSESVSMGAELLAAMPATLQEASSSPKTSAPAATNGKNDQIFDPAFTGNHEVVPIMEELQQFPKDELGDEVVEEQDGVDWPSA